MTVSQYDGVTGKSSSKTYSKYYDDGVWLKPKHVGLSVVVDHEKMRTPVASAVQQEMGWSGPSDSYANGKVTVYIWNLDDRPHQIRILKVTSKGESFERSAAASSAPPKGRSGGVVGNLKIFNYGTELPMKIDYELDGKLGTVELKLVRRTPEENAVYFGAEGTPPYPWFDGGKKWTDLFP
ncbi:MAG TPA: hypothetical protein VD994_12935 [Prosthecobacter sp.]|nr:hypothetical protein [Prosthecobacter sp.]